MKWRFWEKPKRKRPGGRSLDCTPLCPPNCRRGELCTAGLVSDIPDPRKYDPFVAVEPLPDGLEATVEMRGDRVTAISVQQGPIIHNVTGSIDWKDHDIGTRYGPARCNETCTEPHAFGVKVNANTVAYERPCEISDAGMAEWRSRQKRG